MPFDGSDLYQLASRLGMPELRWAAGAPGVMTALEIAAYYSGRRLRHSVARVIEHQVGEVELLVAYEGVRLATTPRIAIEPARMEKLNAVLLAVKFGALEHQPGLSLDDRCLWLIQQAAGAYVHGIIVAPERPEPPYSTIVNAIDDCIPEAIREVPLRHTR